MAPFTLAANIGLILYLFLVGLEIDLRFLASNWRIAVSVASLDMAIPFGMGYVIAYGLYHEFRNEEGVAHINYATYGLFIAIAIAITAFPVLCRILTALNLLNTNVGVIVLSSGIANDVVGWVLLALCVTLVNSGNGITALWVFLTAVGFALFLAFAVRPAFMWVLRKTHSLENGPTQGVVALTIFTVLVSAFFTSVIGAHSVFGAFMVGLMCPHEGGFAIKLTEKLEDLISTLFLPLFFARSGLSTNLGLLDSGIVWAYVVAVIAVAFASKIVGGTMGARLNGLLWRESATIGVLMSCKGLVELIVLNIGLQAGILSTRTFTMFVVMALVTTFSTTPLVSFVYPPSYQRKLKLWKEGKIDWNGNPLQEEGNNADMDKRSDVASRLLIYLRADGLSSLFSVVKLFTGTRISETESPDQLEKGVTTTAETALGPSIEALRKRLRIHSLRLAELSERNSSVMKVSEIDEYAGNDPIMKAFGSTAYDTAREVMISGELVVVPTETFAETITTRASNSHSDFILVPWSETGTISELPSYLGGNSQQDPLANRDFTRLAGDIFERASQVSSVGVFIDRTLMRSSERASAASHGIERLARVPTQGSIGEPLDSNAVTYSSADCRRTRLHVLYAGSNDDIFAVRLALQLAQNDAVFVTITELTASAGSSNEETHINNTTFNDMKAHTSDFLSSRVKFDAIDGFAPTDEYISAALKGDHHQHTVFTVGRSVGATLSSTELSITRSSDITRTLGALAVQLVGQIKKTSLRASLLVVQAKMSAGAEPTSPK